MKQFFVLIFVLLFATSVYSDGQNSMDLNQDGLVTGSDVQMISSAILNSESCGRLHYLDCDLNNDGAVDTLDIQTIVNYIMKNQGEGCIEKPSYENPSKKKCCASDRCAGLAGCFKPGDYLKSSNGGFYYGDGKRVNCNNGEWVLDANWPCEVGDFGAPNRCPFDCGLPSSTNYGEKKRDCEGGVSAPSLFCPTIPCPEEEKGATLTYIGRVDNPNGYDSKMFHYQVNLEDGKTHESITLLVPGGTINRDSLSKYPRFTLSKSKIGPPFTTGPYLVDMHEFSNFQIKKFYPNWEGNVNSRVELGDTFPASGVSREKALTVLSQIGKRLPDITEFIFSLAGTTDRPMPWGEDVARYFNRGNLAITPKYLDSESKEIHTVPVDSFFIGRSYYGLLHTGGNLPELMNPHFVTTPNRELEIVDVSAGNMLGTDLEALIIIDGGMSTSAKGYPLYTQLAGIRGYRSLNDIIFNELDSCDEGESVKLDLDSRNPTMLHGCRDIGVREEYIPFDVTPYLFWHGIKENNYFGSFELVRLTGKISFELNDYSMIQAFSSPDELNYFHRESELCKPKDPNILKNLQTRPLQDGILLHYSDPGRPGGGLYLHGFSKGNEMFLYRKDLICDFTT